MKFKTRIDWWLVLILIALGVIMPVVLVLGISLNWYKEGEGLIVAIIAGVVFVIIITLFVLSFLATYYMLDVQGLTVRNTFFYKKTVPYGKIISVKESVNIVNRPKTWAAPLSVVGIRVDYVKENGNKSWFFIAPKNRQEFMQQLQNRIYKKA